MSQRTRARACNNPAPANGGDPCNPDEGWETESCDEDASRELCIPDGDCYFDGPCVGWDVGAWEFNSGETLSAGTGPSTDYTGTAIPEVGRLCYNSLRPGLYIKTPILNSLYGPVYWLVMDSDNYG